MIFYEGGYYYGKLIFFREFFFKFFSIYMIIFNGRFKCNIRLCFFIMDFYLDMWNLVWFVFIIFIGFLSFMVEKGFILGSIEMLDFMKR